MDNSTQNAGGTMSFQERYSGYSDNQILEILKNHKNYQEAAVSAAVQIAIERQLIHSEQDLMAPEYQSGKPEGSKAFPEITNPYHYQKVVSSIFRILFIVGIIPIAFGIIKYAGGQINMAFPSISAGLIWMLLTFWLLKTRKIAIVLSQIVLLAMVIFGTGYLLITPKIFHLVDLVILIIGSFITLYLLLYLKKLIQTKPEDL
ncbi:MAG TPA: hypothetical protein VF373_06965 [Prolixibacteraceae bacterium]